MESIENEAVMKKRLSNEINELLHKGTVITAHPTALTKELKLDERRQRALSRYYLEAGVGGLAIGVHTSQFEIRQANLYRPVLELGKEEIDTFTFNSKKNILRIAGIIGNTQQAINEAKIASDLGYDAGLVSLADFKDKSNESMIEHCKEIADIIPVIGFFLQVAVGGRYLDNEFWRKFSNIKNVIAIKIAPFNRYQTLEVLRGVVESDRAEEIALYTGNDDNIVGDLFLNYEISTSSKIIRKKIVGGLLGHWAVWTKTAVEIFNKIANANDSDILKLLTLGNKITETNAAFYDAKNNFKGSIAGIHEVLRRQGFLEDIITLNPSEKLSKGQIEEIDRVYSLYPELNDDKFIEENIERWLS